MPTTVRSSDEPMTLRGIVMRTGEVLDEDALGARLAEASVVYVGERHDAVVDHAVQARLVTLTLPDVVGMEMFQQPFQEAIDAYGRGEIDEPTMLERTEWAARWGAPFDVYRPIVDAGRAIDARIVALNAPREWTRAIARGGIESLPEDVRSALPELDLANADHRAMVMEALGGHGGHGGEAMDPAMLERFYLAQVVWDESMGARLSDVVRDGGRAVVIAGRMHVQRGLGIPRTAARRGVTGGLVVLPLTEAEIEAERASPTGLCDIAIPVPE